MKYELEYKLKELYDENVNVVAIIELCKYLRKGYNQLNDNTKLQIVNSFIVELWDRDYDARIPNPVFTHEFKKGFKNKILRIIDEIQDRPIDRNRGFKKQELFDPTINVSTNTREIRLQQFYYEYYYDGITIMCGYDNVTDTLFVSKESCKIIRIDSETF